MRFGLVLVVATLSVSSKAQVPDVILKVDLYPTYRTVEGKATTFRWHDGMGRHGIVGIYASIEGGLFGLVTERFDKIDNDPDDSQIDEAYLESPGLWRIGRQYLAFGQRNILREPALGARYQIGSVKDLPALQVAVFDNGKERLRGVMGRLGGQVGLSLGVGEHFGIAGTNLVQVRRPEESPGLGRGHRVAIGADFSREFGQGTVALEYVGLRRGHGALDRSEDISDLRYIVAGPDGGSRFTAAWSRSWRVKQDFYRLEGELKVAKNFYLRGFTRFQRGQFQDIAIGARIRL